MREYMKNKNEYMEDGRRYIEEIRECRCNEKKENAYLLTCKILERGKKEYTYSFEEEAYLLKGSYFGTKGFWLSDKAKTQVQRAIADFENKIGKAKNGIWIKVDIVPSVMTLYYDFYLKGRFHFLLEYLDEEHKKIIRYREGATLQEMISEITRCMIDQDICAIIRQSDKDTINRNPLYISAVESGNEPLRLLLKLYYRIANEKECDMLSALFGTRVLPSLEEEYDQTYVVDADTIQSAILVRSGYDIRHKPYFAMRGFTHTKWQLNPHTKLGVDAAPNDAETISFQEYLELFEDDHELRKESAKNEK